MDIMTYDDLLRRLENIIAKFKSKIWLNYLHNKLLSIAGRSMFKCLKKLDKIPQFV
jgi:hypothetical protein